MTVMEDTSEEIKEKLPKVYSKELIEILFRLPYTKRQFLIEANMGTPKTVGNYLIALENEGFLKATKVGKEKLYLNQRLMEVLENKEKKQEGTTPAIVHKRTIALTVSSIKDQKLKSSEKAQRRKT